MEKIIYNQIVPETADLTPHMNFIDDVYLKKGITDRMTFFNIYEDENFYTEYERYAEIFELPADVESQLESEHCSKLAYRLHKLSKASKSSSNEYHAHERNFREYVLCNRLFSDPFVHYTKQQFKIQNNMDESGYSFENLPGRNPLSWPLSLDEMLKKLKSLPFNTFFTQPFKLNSEFYPKLEKKYQEHLKLREKSKNGENNFSVLIKIIEVELLVSLLNGSFYHVFIVLEKLKDLSKLLDESQENKLIEHLKKAVGFSVKEIIYDIDKVHYDFCPVPYQIAKSFTLGELKTCDFNVQDYSVTTDGTYIYELLSSNNCLQINKIGTGSASTEPGFVYNTKKIALPFQKHASMIYLQGKLYVTNSNEKPGVIEIYDKDTLEKEKKIVLDVKKYFKNVHLVQYNKYFQLFTDGKNIYTVLINSRFVKNEEEPKKEEVVGESNAQDDTARTTPKPPSEQNLNQPAEGSQKKDAEKTDKDNEETVKIQTKVPEPIFVKKKSLNPESDPKPSFTFNVRKPDIKHQDILDKTTNIEDLRNRIEKRIQEMEKQHIENFEESLDFPADMEYLSKDNMEDSYMNLRSINLIKNIFRNSVLKGEEAQGEGIRSAYFRNERLNPFKNFDGNNNPSDFFYDYMEVNKISNRRNIKKTVDNVKKTAAVLNNNERVFIDFYVLKFNVNEEENAVEKSQTKVVQKTPALVELFESFAGLFSYEDCEKALQECGGDLQSAAEMIIEHGHKQDKFCEYSPIDETLIYQTEALNNDFRQTRIVKAFNVAPKSLLTPLDVMNSNWFVKDNLLLKSSGHLFSLNPSDSIVVDPKDLEKDYADSFFKKRNSELNILLKEANLKPEYIEKLYAKLSEQLEDKLLYKGLISRGVSESEGQSTHKISTTFIKTYDDVFYNTNVNRKLTYDYKNNQFISVNFERMPKSNYNFVREKFTYYNDNNKLGQMLDSIAAIKNEYKKCPFLYYAEILSSSTISAFVSKFISFMLYVNVNRANVPFRLNDWAWSYKEQTKTVVANDKKKKSLLNSKIKKLNELKAKNFKKKSISERFNKKFKTPYYREICYNYYLCSKGSLKTFEMLVRFYEKSTDEISRENIRALLKIFPEFVECAHDQDQIARVNDYLLKKLTMSDERLFYEKLYLSICHIIFQDKDLFVKTFAKLLQEDTELLIELLNKLFAENELIENSCQFNQRLIIASNKNFSFDDANEEHTKYSYTLDIKFNIFKALNYEFSKTNFLEQMMNRLKETETSKKVVILKSIRKMVEILVIGISNTDKDKKEELKIETDPSEFIINIYNYLKELIGLSITDLSSTKMSENYFKECLNLQDIFNSLITKKQIQRVINVDKAVKYIFEYSESLLKYLANAGVNLKRSDNKLQKLSKEGISQVESYVIETQHPIERGKNTIFKRIYNNDVIGFYLEFDKRCQDEENSDTLMISSWYHPEIKGTTITAQDMTFYKHISIAGKKTNFAPLFMVGDTLDVQFISSQIAKNNVKSLNQWGYRILVRPIYKGTVNIKENSKFQDRTLALRACRNLESTAIVLRSLMDNYLKGFNSCTKDQDLVPFLDWNILHNGLYYLNKEKFLKEKENGNYQFIDDKPLKTIGLNSETNNSDKISSKSKTLYDKISVLDEELEVDTLLATLKDKSAPVSELVSVIKSLKPINIAYKAERQRPFFFKDIQMMWDDVEEQIILCYLKHTGLLYLLKSQNKTDLKLLVEQQNIREQLSNIAKNKEDVIAYMLKEVQLEKEYNMLLDGVFEIIKDSVIVDYVKPRISKLKEEVNNPVVNIKQSTKERIKTIIRSKNKKKTQKQTPNLSVKEEISKKGSTVEEESKHYYFTASELSEILSQAKIKEQMIKLIADRFEGNDENLKKIFIRKGIEYIREVKVNYDMMLNNLITVLKEHLEKSKSEVRYQMDISFPNPYKIIAEKIQARSLFLLKLETTKKLQTNKQLEDHEFPSITLDREISMRQDSIDDLKPLGMGRSLTSDVKTTKRLQPVKEDINMRNWLDSYKHWKESMSNKEEDVRSKDCSPSFAVSKFLKIEENIDVHEIERIMLRCSHRATLRIVGMQNYRTAINLFENTWLFDYFVNLSSSLYSDLSLFENIKTTHAEFKNIICTEAFSILNILYSESNRIVKIIQKATPADLYSLKNELINTDEEKFSVRIEQFVNMMKELLNLHTEIITLSSNHYFRKYINKLIKEKDSKAKNFNLFVETLELTLQFLLFTKSLSNLSIDFRFVNTLAGLSFKTAKVVCSTLVGALNKDLLSFKVLLKCIENEVCLTSNTSQCKFFVKKLNDRIGAERVICLLNILRTSLKTGRETKGFDKLLKDQDLCGSLTKNIFKILYYSKNITINQLCCNILPLLIPQKNLDKILLNDNFLKNHSVLDPDTILSSKINAQKPKLETLDSKITFDESKLGQSAQNNNELKNMDLIFLDMGNSISPIKEVENKPNHTVLLYLFNEEDLTPLVRLLYYWEVQNPSISVNLPTTIEEYEEYISNIDDKLGISDKKVKRVSKNERDVSYHDQMSKALKLKENLITTLPHFDGFPDLQKNMGWYINFTDVFRTHKAAKKQRASVVFKSPKKIWDLKNLNKLIVTLTDLIKSLKTPKMVLKEARAKKDQQESGDFDFKDSFGLDNLFNENPVLSTQISKDESQKPKDENPETEIPKNEDTFDAENLPDIISDTNQAESKSVFKIKSRKNSEICKLDKHRAEEERKKKDKEFLELFKFLKILLEMSRSVLYMASLLNYTGYTQLLLPQSAFKGTYQKAEEFTYMLNIFLHNKLKELDTSFITDESVSKKLQPILKCVNNTITIKGLNSAIVESNVSQLFAEHINSIDKMKVPSEDLPKYLNKYNILAYISWDSKARRSKLQTVAEFIKQSMQSNYPIRRYVTENYLKVLRNEPLHENPDISKVLELGYLALYSNRGDNYFMGQIVKGKISNQNFRIISNKYTTGKDQLLAINEKETKACLKLEKDSIQLHQTMTDIVGMFKDVADIWLTAFFDQIKILKASPLNPFESDPIKIQSMISLRFKIIVIMNVVKNLIEENVIQTSPDTISELQKELEEGFKEYDTVKNEFVRRFESLLNITRKSYLVVPQKFTQPEMPFDFELERRKLSKSLKEVKQSSNIAIIDNFAYTLSKSSFISDMRMSHPKSNDFKMLKHWEKHIIPKILNFVKGSLSAYEIDDFFEQMRIELRKENNAQASNIAYILCDQKLPNDCFLPELNYDWSTLDIDEINIGQYVTVKIKDERCLYSVCFEQFNKLGITNVLGQVIFKDVANKCINILVNDLTLSNTFSVWVPQQAIRSIETPIDLPSNSFPLDYHLRNFEKCFQNFYKTMVRDFVIQGSLYSQSTIDFSKCYSLFRLAAQTELKSNCLSGWLAVNSNNLELKVKNQKLNSLLTKILTKENVEHFTTEIVNEANSLVNFFITNNYSCNLKDHIEDDIYTADKIEEKNLKLSKLNIFKNKDQVSGIVIDFKKEANLFKCSGLKFFSDPEGINMLEHLQATTKTAVNNLQPIVFGNPNIYCSFYYNAEALPMYMQNQTTTNLSCSVFAIPFSWNYFMWSVDVLTTYASLEGDVNLTIKLLMILKDFTEAFKGPTECKKYIYKLIGRSLMKMKPLIKMSITNSDLLKDALINFSQVIKAIYTDFKVYIEMETAGLYSNVLQEMSECITIYTAVCDAVSLNPGIEDNKSIMELCDLINIAEFLHSKKGRLSDRVLNQFKTNFSSKKYYSHFFLIQNLPQLNSGSVKSMIKEIIDSHKLKILVEDLDIYIPSDSDDNTVGYAVILHDGWIAPNIDDVQVEEAENEEVKEEEQPERLWMCEVCTLNNLDSSAICMACDTPKPAVPTYIEDEEKKVEKTEEDHYFSNVKRLSRLKDAILVGFERLTPDKRIEVKTFDNDSNSIDQFLESNEYLEFILNRITSDLFMERLPIAIPEIFKVISEKEKKDLDVASIESLQAYLQDLEPAMLFETLFQYGFDYWLEKSCLGVSETDTLKLINRWDIPKFLEFCETNICNDSIYINELDPFNFRLEFKNCLKAVDIFDKDALTKLKYKESINFYYRAMKFVGYSNFEFKSTVAVIQQLNHILSKNFKLINMRLLANEDLSNAMPLSLGSLLANIRDYYLSPFKNKIVDELLASTALARDETPKVVVERLTKEKEIITDRNPNETKNQRRKDRGYEDNKNSVLLQAYKQMNEICPTMMRPVKPKGSEPFIAFEIIFKGEHVMGEAGPYRQFFADISSELQSTDNPCNFVDESKKKLQLLIPSPNRQSETGDFKEKFIINPSCTSAYHLQLYEFLGLLMGCAFRTGTFLTLELPTIFWKKLVNQSIIEEDIAEIDRGLVDLVKYIKQSTPDVFDDMIFETFTTYLSNKQRIELVPNGEHIKVNYENRLEYIEKVVNVRINEANFQIEAIKRGFIKIVPQALLNCLTAKDLERLVCGRNELDFNLLKRNTRYSGNLKEDSQLIKNFWAVLFELSDKDKLKFVKFCWGQERLPSTTEAFDNSSIRFMIKPAQYEGNQDGILPRADTCFFNFELPNYSTKEIMREKILLAIHTDCDSMNAEERMSNNNNNYDDGISLAYYSDYSDGVMET